MKPLAFKVRTPGHYTGVNGGDIKKGGGGCGAIWYEDKTFTIAATQDQWLCASTAENNYTYNPPKMNPSTKPLRYLSVCSGMEAATVAWHHMGWTPVGFSEIEAFPSQILKPHYPTIPNYGDLTKFKEWNIQPGSIDLLVGGTPCQAFSVAGLRKGLDDPRGNLALTFLALADHLRPKYILWENVPGVLSSNKGEDFASFISALAELRYGFAWRVCDAQYFGVPQRRKRVFLLAIEGAGNWKTAAEILFERKSLCGDIEESDKAGEGVTSDAGASVETSGRNTVGTLDTECGFGKQTHQSMVSGHIVPTVLDRASFNQGQNAQYEPLIEQTETCPTLVSRGPHAVQVTNPALYENRPTDSRITGPLDVAPTMTSRFGTGGGNIPLVNLEPKIIKTSELRLSGKITEQETCPTLTAGAKGGDSEPLAITFQPGNLRRDAGADPSTQATTTLKATPGDQMPHVAYPLDLRNATRSPEKQDAMNRQGAGLGNDGDPSPTLTKGFVPGVAHPQGVDLYNQALTGDLHCPLRTAGGHGAPAVLQSDFNITQNPVAGTLDSHYYKGPGSRQGGEREYIAVFDVFNQSVSSVNQTLNSSASDACHTGTVFSQTMAVRRLTPRECERLQGFPDDYSMIPWKGKPASECPDGPRYKACGNSMAVPVMRFIGERIQKQIDGTL
jgi:DNA (cytosine-5)-methyltransferase 1